MGLLGYIVRRLPGLALVLLGVSILVFVLLRGMPGVDPLSAYITPGLPMSPEALRGLRDELHLDQPLPVQYFHYVADLLRGDWGYSRTAAQPVISALLERLPATVELALAAVQLFLHALSLHWSMHDFSVALHAVVHVNGPIGKSAKAGRDSIDRGGTHCMFINKFSRCIHRIDCTF